MLLNRLSFVVFFWRNFETAQDFRSPDWLEIVGMVYNCREVFDSQLGKVWLDMSELVNHEIPLKTNHHFQKEIHRLIHGGFSIVISVFGE